MSDAQLNSVSTYRRSIEVLLHRDVVVALSRQDDPLATDWGVVEAGLVTLVNLLVEISVEEPVGLYGWCHGHVGGCRQLTGLAVLGAPNWKTEGV